jgi:hypothetical protein
MCPEHCVITDMPPQAQTPKQKRANEKYAKHEAAKRGKPENAVKRQQREKSPVSIGWIGMFPTRFGQLFCMIVAEMLSAPRFHLMWRPSIRAPENTSRDLVDNRVFL